MRQTVTQWEEDHCRPFMVHDVRYLDRIDSEVQQHISAKEEEKNKRVSLCVGGGLINCLLYSIVCYCHSNKWRLKPLCWKWNLVQKQPHPMLKGTCTSYVLDYWYCTCMYMYLNLMLYCMSYRKAACLTPGPVDKMAKVRKVEPSPLTKSSSVKSRQATKARTKKIVSLYNITTRNYVQVY